MPATPHATAPQKGYQKLVERLSAFINEGNFASGDKLPPERALAERFGVSRPSIRQAILSLSERGILESRQGDGTYVLSPDTSQFAKAVLDAVSAKHSNFVHIMEFRRFLESAVASLAATRCDADRLKALKAAVCDQQRCLMHGTDDSEPDARFHLALAEATDNPVFLDIMTHLNDLYAEGRARELRDREWLKSSLEGHLRIIDALERKDPEACRKAMLAHLDFINEAHVFSLKKDD